MPPKQEDIPGVEGPGVSRPKVKEIDKAAAKYIGIRDDRMTLTEKEVEARATLSEVMHKHNLTRYIYDDQLVTVEPGKEKIKVRTVDEPEDLENTDDDNN